MSSFEVTGGNRLKGTIIPQGAKNEALQILSAVLLTASPVTISNIPDILDVNLLIELLGDIGVKITRIDQHSCTFSCVGHFQKKRRPSAGECDVCGANAGKV